MMTSSYDCDYSSERQLGRMQFLVSHHDFNWSLHIQLIDPAK